MSTGLPNPDARIGTRSRYAIQKSKAGLKSGAAPTFAGITLTGLTASRLTATDSAKALASVADLTSWVAGTENEIDVTSDGDGTITIDLSSTISLGNSV